MATKINTPIPYSEHATFSFTSDLIAPYKYQWKRDGVHLVHGGDKTYTTPPLRPEDFKAKYSVTVFGQDAIEESNAVAIVDTIPKTPVKAVAPVPAPVHMATPTHSSLYTPERRMKVGVSPTGIERRVSL